MQRYKMPIILAIGLPVAFAVFWLVTASSAATETRDYTVVSKGQKFEIRDYPN